MRNEEINMLLEAGFGFFEEEWHKGSWTIRFDNDMMEAFDNNSDKYFYGNRNSLDIILEDIV